MTDLLMPEEDPVTALRLERRRLLRTSENPNRKIDYLVVLTRQQNGEKPRMVLSYVPGKLLLRPEAFEDYVAAAVDAAPETLEALALEVLDDVNNELVPRWAQVRVENAPHGDGAHTVIVEDRQPKWDNPALLSRLR